MKGKGSLLLTAVWFLALFSLFVSSLAFQASSQLKMASRERNLFFDHHLWVSGLNRVLSLVEADPEPYQDTPLDAWYGVLPHEGRGNEKVSIEVGDESAKLDLNRAGEGLLDHFFKDLGMEEAGIQIIEHRRKQKGRTFSSLEELLLVPHVTRADYDRFKPYLTVYGNHPEPQVNIHTVSVFLLKVIMKSIPGDEAAKRELVEKILEWRNRGQAGYFAPEEFTPALFSAKLDLSSSLQMAGLIQALLPYLTCDSRIFRVRFLSPAGNNHAEAVIESRENSFRPFEILFWHEA